MLTWCQIKQSYFKLEIPKGHTKLKVTVERSYEEEKISKRDISITHVKSLIQIHFPIPCSDKVPLCAYLEFFSYEDHEKARCQENRSKMDVSYTNTDSSGFFQLKSFVHSFLRSQLTFIYMTIKIIRYGNLFEISKKRFIICYSPKLLIYLVLLLVLV